MVRRSRLLGEFFLRLDHNGSASRPVLLPNLGARCKQLGEFLEQPGRLGRLLHDLSRHVLIDGFDPRLANPLHLADCDAIANFATGFRNVHYVYCRRNWLSESTL